MGDKYAIIELIKNQITAKTTQLTTDNIQKITNDIQSLLKILNDLATIEFVATVDCKFNSNFWTNLSA